MLGKSMLEKIEIKYPFHKGNLATVSKKVAVVCLQQYFCSFWAGFTKCFDLALILERVGAARSGP